MHAFLILAVVIEAIVVIVVGSAWLVARHARTTANACDFPGCIQARADLRRLADQHEAVPRQDVLDVVDGVEAHEHGGAA